MTGNENAKPGERSDFQHRVRLQLVAELPFSMATAKGLGQGAILGGKASMTTASTGSSHLPWRERLDWHCLRGAQGGAPLEVPLSGPDFRSIHFTEMLYARCWERRSERGRAGLGNLQHLTPGLPRSTGPTNKYVCMGGKLYSHPCIHPFIHSFRLSLSMYGVLLVCQALVPESQHSICPWQRTTAYICLWSLPCSGSDAWQHLRTGRLTRERGTVLLGMYGVYTSYAPCHAGPKCGRPTLVCPAGAGGVLQKTGD